MSVKSGSNAVAAVISQGIVAASTLLLTIMAGAENGVAGLGQFSLLFGLLITFNSLQTGWIGDSLTVLDRFDPAVRAALVRSQYVTVALVGAAGTLIGWANDDAGRWIVVAFPVAAVLWCVEETGRRLLIARQSYWSLCVNDGVYAAVSFAVALGVALTGRLTLPWLFVAIAAGAVAAIGCALVQLPSNEWRPGSTRGAAMRELASFAVWRSAQVALRPAAMSAMRLLVLWTSSKAILGQLEAARLLMTPVFTALAGIGVYLLPTYTAAVKNRRPFRPSVPTMSAALVGAVVGYLALTIALRGPLNELLVDDATVTVGGLVAWAAFFAAFGLGIPPGNAVVASGRSRHAFWVRLVDSAIGVAGAGVLCLADAQKYAAAGLAVGAVAGGVMLFAVVESGPPHASDDREM